MAKVKVTRHNTKWIRIDLYSKYSLCRHIPFVFPQFSRFLKEQNLFIAFMRGVNKTADAIKKHHININLSLNMHDLTAFPIDRSLIWAETAEGAQIWSPMHNKWVGIMNDRISEDVEEKLMEIAINKYNATELP